MCSTDYWNANKNCLWFSCIKILWKFRWSTGIFIRILPSIITKTHFRSPKCQHDKRTTSALCRPHGPYASFLDVYSRSSERTTSKRVWCNQNGSHHRPFLLIFVLCCMDSQSSFIWSFINIVHPRSRETYTQRKLDQKSLLLLFWYSSLVWSISNFHSIICGVRKRFAE